MKIIFALALAQAVTFGFGTNVLASKKLNSPQTVKVGTSKNTKISPDFSDGLQTATTGILKWKKEIREPGAAFVRLHYNNFNLRPGDELIVRTQSGRIVEKLTLQGPKGRKSFWGLSVFGEAVLLELRHSGGYEGAPFEIDKVVKGENLPQAKEINNKTPVEAFLDSLVSDARPESICGQGDYIDAKCVESDEGKWSNVLASVGVMSVGGDAALWCSGSNISPNNYVLTNAHCIETQDKCDSSEFVFHYHRTECGTSAQTSEWVSYRCDEMVAVSPFDDCDPAPGAFDYSLNKVDGDPASRFGYAKVDNVPLTSGEAIYIVQHPDGRPKEIAQGAGPMVRVENHTIRYFDTLDTEPGSSGSPIYRASDNKLVGLHHCGGCDDPTSGNRGALMSDIYPEIASYLCKSGTAVNFSKYEQLSQVEGNGDTVLDPGETWEFYVIVKNGSCDSEAQNLTARLESLSEGVKLLTDRVQFPIVAAGSSGKSIEPIRFKIESNFPCGETVKIAAKELASSLGPILDSNDNFFEKISGAEDLVNVASEDFAGGLPQGWTIEDNGTGAGPAQTWNIENPGKRNTGLTPPFFIVDSDTHGKDNAMDESLVTKTLDFSGFKSVNLEFSTNFRKYGSEIGDVDIKSTATQGRWLNVARYSGKNETGHKKIDVTDYSAGHSDVQVRFHYYNGTYVWYWAVDDFYLVGSRGYVCN